MENLEVRELKELTKRSDLMASICDIVGKIPVDSMCAVTVRLWLTLTLQSIACFVKARKCVVDILVTERGLCAENTREYAMYDDLICQMQSKSYYHEHFDGSWHEVSTIIGTLLRSDNIACQVCMRDRLVSFYNTQLAAMGEGIDSIDSTRAIAQGCDDIWYYTDASRCIKELLSLIPPTDSVAVDAYKSALYCLGMQLLQ